MKKKFLTVLLLITLSIISYGNTLNVPFTYDDDNYIVQNPSIKSFSYFSDPSAVYTLRELSPTYQSSFNTRILGYLTFAVNYRINGLDVWGYHALNLIIHTANTVLVYFLVLLTLRILMLKKNTQVGESNLADRDLLIPIMVAVLFCVHPINTSGVTYISQRFASLVTFFYLLAFISFIMYRTSGTQLSRRIWYASVFASTVAGMLTKENAFTLPYLLAAFDLIFFRLEKKTLLNHIPFLLASLIIPFNILRTQRLLADHSGMNAIYVLGASDNITGYDYFVTQFRVLLTYLRLLIFPVRQRVFYDIPVYHSMLEPPVLLSVLVFLCILAAAGSFWFLGRQKNRPYYTLASFGMLWFLGTLSVESSFIPNINLMMEYRLYLPLPGFLLAVVPPLLGEVGKMRIVVVVALAVSASALTGATIVRNQVWRNNVSLWEDNVTKSPESAQAHHFLTVAYAKSGRYYSAMAHAQRALELRPDYIEVHINLGLVYAELGYYDESLNELNIARNLSPSYAPINDIIREINDRRDAAFRKQQPVP